MREYPFVIVIAALMTYAVAYLWAFVFQTLYLLLDSLGPGATDPAFTPGEFPLSYGLVTLGVFLVGLALVCLGHGVRGRWSARRDRTTQSTVSSR